MGFALGTGNSIIPLQNFVDEFVHKVYKPYLPTTVTVGTTGNTDGWNRVVETLINGMFPDYTRTKVLTLSAQQRAMVC